MRVEGTWSGRFILLAFSFPPPPPYNLCWVTPDWSHYIITFKLKNQFFCLCCNLYRWHFVIYGGIDGFSQMIMFLQCNTNNKAATVLRLLQSAIATCMSVQTKGEKMWWLHYMCSTIHFMVLIEGVYRMQCT